ncbi:MLP-like protein 43 [Humulus lupulus]|uniref:MLP-like protein 43 n=1 Tax=Humulus lupulus TaxID=3486 RepID=UPI002B40BDD3|nr:MLP-like protein 43 [Humulus lupulus]
MSSSTELCGKLETNVEIKAPAEKFYHIFKHTPHNVHNLTENFHGCEVHEGEWGTEGSIICWDYFHDGKRMVSKQIVEAIDDEKNSITFKCIEGDLMEHYKNFNIILVVTPKAEGEGSVVHWCFDYEKHHGEIIDPHTLIELANEVTNDLASHLAQA